MYPTTLLSYLLDSFLRTYLARESGKVNMLLTVMPCSCTLLQMLYTHADTHGRHGARQHAAL